MDKQHFYKLTFPVADPDQDLWVAMLSLAGCYGFEQEESQLHAFIRPEDYEEGEFRSSLEELLPGETIAWTMESIEDRDWNAEWEANFHGIQVGTFAEVIPPFKTADPAISHTVIVAPKQAFGTGHHGTTRMMIRQAETLDFKGKQVLDMGCGSGVLAILAAKLGAERVLAVDYDPWSTENTAENIGHNQVQTVDILLGEGDVLPDRQFDIIFANINRNVLLAEAGRLASRLKEDGTLLLSGFHEADIPLITDAYQAFGLQTVKKLNEDEWVSLALMRKGE